MEEVKPPQMPTGPPPASGARFRCTCCQEEVYESQLDYHASYCLPPALPRIAERRESGQTNSSEGPLSQSPSYSAQIDLAKEILFPKEKKRWWRWEESEIQIHHAEAEERSARKRQELLEDLKRKEEEECTFTPRLVARRSRSCGRESQDLSRKSKESVEFEMYREVTHQPQITRMAHSLGRHREAESLSVFERLYHVAQERSKARKQMEAEATQQEPRPRRSRSADPCHSLYLQGLERRARLLQGQQSQERLTQQVSGRSREYYWQMLDRQIREAFEKATSASSGSHLAYSELEDFLYHFGVAKLEAPADRSHEESRKLQRSLWRHLDPEEVGYVDFLTLQVFFWVLMVAVADESQEAQKLHNLAQRASQETSDQSGESEALRVANAKIAASMVAPEGSRICELLMRFNPKQLRHEFRQLYLDRLHHGRQVPEAEEVATTRSLSSKSRRLAEQKRRKMQEESGTSRHVDLLLWRQHQVEVQRQRLREQKAAKEAEECTFRPCLLHRRSSVVPGGSRLYDLATKRQKCREELALAQERSRLEREMADCTFQPNLRKSGKSFNGTSKSFKPSPRGADESARRMRKAFAEKDSRRRFLEERAPASPEKLKEETPESPFSRSEDLEELRARSLWLTPNSSSISSKAVTCSPEASARASRQRRVQPKQRLQRPKAKVSPKGPNGATRSPSGELAVRPLLVAEVSISKDIPPDQIVIYESDNVAEVAQRFAEKHRLEPQLFERLKRYLSDLTQR